MGKKRILIVGMLDSIHIARWLKQLQNTDLQLIVFPSTHFKLPHRQLFNLSRPTIRVLGLSLFGNFLGYVDSLLTLRFMNQHIGLIMRKIYLRITIRVFRPDIIHAIEIQHAGYLVSSISASSNRRILTNWGSDIYYFQHKPEHVKRIRVSLEWASDYSAECARDYELAKDFGFQGRNLPKIPNAGGFESYGSPSKCSSRKLILVKSYGGEFGAGKIAIEAIRIFLDEYKEFKVFFYSVTQDLLDQVESLKTDFPKIVEFSTLGNPLPQEALMKLFTQARIYLGCSYSDGLSTSFLQALCTGAYPIQTNTSCADELISDGAAGHIVSLDKDVIFSILEGIIFDDEVLNQAQKINAEYSNLKLDANKIAELAKSYY